MRDKNKKNRQFQKYKSLKLPLSKNIVTQKNYFGFAY